MRNPVVWFEVRGRDLDRLLPFYQKMFGWPLERDAHEDYHMITQRVEQGIPGGIGKAAQGEGQSTFYVQVKDLTGALEQSTRLGGRVLVPATTLPGGTTLAMIADPEGHPVGLVQEAT